MAQLNWWLPIYPLAADNCMAFDPRNFANPVDNDSDKFNYYRRNVERKDARAVYKRRSARSTLCRRLGRR